MPTIQKNAQRLIAGGLASAEDMRGCSDADIRQVDSLVDAKLPTAYKEFLKAMGRGAGAFLTGTDLFFPKLLELRGWAETLLSRTGSPFTLPPDSFVFLVHQGYQFMFFGLGQGDDPAVLHFEEGEDKPQVVFNHFTDWLAAAIEDEIAASRDLQRN